MMKLSHFAILATLALPAMVLVSCSEAVGEASAEPTNVSEMIEAKAPTRVSSVEPSQKALEDQIRCYDPLQPRKAIIALLKRKLFRKGPDAWDGADYYYPTGEFKVFGYPVEKVTGWDRSIYSGKDIFWYAGSGTAPPTFLEIRLVGSSSDVKETFIKKGVEVRLIDLEQSTDSVTVVTCNSDD